MVRKDFNSSIFKLLLQVLTRLFDVGKFKSVLFLYSNGGNIERVKQYLTNNSGWDFSNSIETKELNLTHNLIAGKAGFRSLMDVYDSDPIVGLKNDILKKIKDNKKNNKSEIRIQEEDTFDIVVDKFQLKNKKKQLKKDILLADPANKLLYDWSC